MKYTKFFHHDNCLEAYDAPSLRFSYRGGNCVLSELHDTTPFLVVFNTKDFLVCTLDSSFTGKNKKKYDLYSGLWDKKRVKVKMSPFKKHFRLPLLNKEGLS